MLKKIVILLGVIALLGCIVGWYAYKGVYNDNINDTTQIDELAIPTGSTFKDIVTLLQKNNVLTDVRSFKQLSKLMKYDKGNATVPSGLYPLDKSWSNRKLITVLRSGHQKPVKVTFNNKRTIYETLGNIASYLEIDSVTLVDYFMDEERLNNSGYTRENVLSMLIPNTYEFYWNASSEKIWTRLQKEHDRFWSQKSREAKLTNQGLSKSEAYTLASIVEKESQAAKERPTIAGLYLNRIKRGIPLQADPTVVFATGDFSIRRVLNKHLETDSPYNTYKYAGLPPGPIYLPSIQSIDAVLNPEQHDYLFMCAKPGYQSEHAFAKTSAEHSRNANRYRNWLNKEGIRK